MFLHSPLLPVQDEISIPSFPGRVRHCARSSGPSTPQSPKGKVWKSMEKYSTNYLILFGHPPIFGQQYIYIVLNYPSNVPQKLQQLYMILLPSTPWKAFSWDFHVCSPLRSSPEVWEWTKWSLARDTPSLRGHAVLCVDMCWLSFSQINEATTNEALSCFIMIGLV